MKTIGRYIQQSYLTTFLAALGILTFVLSIGISFKITDLLARGAAWQPLCLIVLTGVPSALALATPISALVASLLVFGRLSADGEITGMRACGISLSKIVERPVMVAIVLAVICLINGFEIAPRGHNLQRVTMTKLGMMAPMQLIEEGRFIDNFDGYSVYVGKKTETELLDIYINDFSDKKATREITAKRGRIIVGTNNMDMAVMLYDVRIDPFPNQTTAGYCDEFPFVIKGSSKQDTYKRRPADFNLIELIEGIMNPKTLYPQIKGDMLSMQKSILKVELNERIVLAVSCIGFVMLGIPLGIKAHRKESTIGVAISLAFVANFYIFILLAESLAKHPAFYPELIVWLPVVISVGLGTILIRRGN